MSTDPAQDPTGDPGARIDALAGGVTGPEDHTGLLALWDAVLSLPAWWFLLVPSDRAGAGDTGNGAHPATSPALATIEGVPMLLVFTSSERARGFAVAHAMVGADEAVQGSALTPADCLADAEAWAAQGVHSLMFDVHVSGFAIPVDQLGTIRAAVDAARRDAADPTDGEA